MGLERGVPLFCPGLPDTDEGLARALLTSAILSRDYDGHNVVRGV